MLVDQLKSIRHLYEGLSTRLRDPEHLCRSRYLMRQRDVLEDVRGCNQVEAPVRPRQLRGAAAHYVRSRDPLPRPFHSFRHDLDAVDVVETVCQGQQEITVAAADIENTIRGRFVEAEIGKHGAEEIILFGTRKL